MKQHVDYTDFYTNEHYGIIRDRVTILEIETGSILECYHDSYTNKYCIHCVSEK